MREGADRRLVVGAIVVGVIFDVAARSGLATVAGTAWVCVIAAALLLGGRARGGSARLLIAAAPALALFFVLRASPWVLAPAVFAVVLTLLVGVSLGADAGGLAATFPALGTRIAIALGHLALAPGMFGQRADSGRGVTASRRASAIARGALLGAPVMLVIGVLLAVADPIFRSWFDLSSITRHLVLISVGAWAATGLARAASAAKPSPALPPARALGVIEASCVLGGLCALYAAFVVAQFIALSAGGRHVLLTRGLTYAQYARGGFFELLACAAITLLVLLGVRACANRDHVVLKVLSALTVALTLGVVIVAIGRLRLYEAAFGLTMLRLACLVAAVWIGAVFLLLGATFFRRGLPRRLFPASMLVSGLLVIAAWGAANPASIVARTNLDRVRIGQRFDTQEAASLGPDATPALLAGIGRLTSVQQAELRRALCQGRPARVAGVAFNMSLSRAAAALAAACGSQRALAATTALSTDR